MLPEDAIRAVPDPGPAWPAAARLYACRSRRRQAWIGAAARIAAGVPSAMQPVVNVVLPVFGIILAATAGAVVTLAALLGGWGGGFGK